MVVKDVDDKWQDYEWVKDHLIIQLIPVKQNRNTLLIAPHRVYNEDFASVYRVMVDKTADTIATFLVNNNFLDKWGITVERLHEDAVLSQRKIDPPQLSPLLSIINGLAGIESESEEESTAWVATNSSMHYGASVILDPDFMYDASEKLGNFYILPSSVHECLFIKEGDWQSPASLEAMIRDVNKNVVVADDYLSDTLYRFKDGVFMHCEITEEETDD